MVTLEVLIIDGYKGKMVVLHKHTQDTHTIKLTINMICPTKGFSQGKIVRVLSRAGGGGRRRPISTLSHGPMGFSTELATTSSQCCPGTEQ